MSERSTRFPANFPVMLRKGPDMYQATICNISSGGGCIIGTHTMTKGDTATLDYAVGQTRATVMWSVGNMAGLKFDNQLSVVGLNCIKALKAVA